MEAEDAQVAVAQYAAAGVAHGEGMRGIVDDLQVVDIGDPLDSLDIAGVAVAMHRQDRGGLRVIAASIRDGSRFMESWSMSTKIGLSPFHSSA